MRQNSSELSNSPNVSVEHKQRTSSPSGRLRPRSSETERGLPKALRIGFSCEHRGRYFRSSKRRIRWSFEIHSEEHEVVLVWSLKSGKTRIYWNRLDISNLFHTQGKSGLLELSWETRSQEKLQVVAHSESTPGSVQYDLLIDGVSFFGLPSREMAHAMASRRAAAPSLQPSSLTASFHGESRAESTSDLSDGPSQPDPGMPYEDLGVRLSLAGLSAGIAGREPVDELHSDVYSTMVESLRSEITNHLPQTEGLVSRAIIHAFFPDSDSETSPTYESFSVAERDPHQVEVDCLSRAFEWTKLNLEYAPGPDVEDRILSYFQKHVENVFSFVRNEELSPEDATRILLNVAAVLQLDFARPLLEDTVVFQGVNQMELDDLSGHLLAYGPLVAVGLDKMRGIAFCRFGEPTSLERLKAASVNGEALLGHVTVLSERLRQRRVAETEDSLPERVDASEGSTEEEIFLGTSRGGDSVPHLMAALSHDDVLFGNPDINPLVVNRCVSDGWIDTELYDGMKMPRQISPDSVAHLKRRSPFAPNAGETEF